MSWRFQPWCSPLWLTWLKAPVLLLKVPLPMGLGTKQTICCSPRRSGCSQSNAKNHNVSGLWTRPTCTRVHTNELNTRVSISPLCRGRGYSTVRVNTFKVTSAVFSTVCADVWFFVLIELKFAYPIYPTSSADERWRTCFKVFFYSSNRLLFLFLLLLLGGGVGGCGD